MGMRACVFAIGLFKKDIADCLDYSTESYENVDEGVIVVRQNLFQCSSDSQSRELAALLGIEAWDFNRHWLEKGQGINLDGLLEVDSSFENDYDCYNRLRKAGFKFMFIPNG